MKIWEDQIVLEILIKTISYMFLSIAQESYASECLHYLKKQEKKKNQHWLVWSSTHNMLNFNLGYSSPLMPHHTCNLCALCSALLLCSPKLTYSLNISSQSLQYGCGPRLCLLYNMKRHKCRNSIYTWVEFIRPVFVIKHVNGAI